MPIKAKRRIIRKHQRIPAKKLRKRRHIQTIAIIYHALEEDNQEYFSKNHELIDNDTLTTVRTIKGILKSGGFKVQEIRISEHDISSIKKIRADYIFNLADSKAMEIKIAGILERMHIPFSGSSCEAIHNGNNKIRTKAVFSKFRIPNPDFVTIMPGDKVTRSMLPGKFPLIVKPAFEHGSIGISQKSVISNFRQLQNTVRLMRRKVKQTLICEKFIKGKEIQILVLERRGETIALPPSEMIFRGKLKTKWNIYGFTEKWRKGSVLFKKLHFVAPPKGISALTLMKMQRDAIKAFYGMGFRDYARFDLRYNSKIKQWYFLEGNPNPGLSANPEDASTASMVAFGLPFEEFILTIIRNSLPQ